MGQHTSYFESEVGNYNKRHLFIPIEEEDDMRIVVVEDEAPIREGMAKLLSKINPEYELVGKAADGEAAIS